MAAQDDFERYYAEKIWALIPEVYRNEDGLAASPDVLRQLVEVVAQQAAITRRSIDRLWEDQHIETCDDWAVPYLGDLVGTRLLSELDTRARRVDVARTIHFRRRRGTPSLLEALVQEISGWDVVMVEAFRRLLRTAHRLDAFPPPVGRVTRTPAAGTANLRSARNAELHPGAFDELFSTADMRQQRGRLGLLNISKLNFHVFRTRAFEVTDVTPYRLQDLGPVTFTVDPSGRDIPLFSRGLPVTNALGLCNSPWADLPGPGATPPLDEGLVCEKRCVSTDEWEVARPIPCRLLSEAAFELDSDSVLAAIGNGAPSTALNTLAGFRFDSEARLRAQLTALGVSFTPQPSWYRQLLRDTVTTASAKPKLLPPAELDSVNISLEEGDPAPLFDQTTGANLASRACHPLPSDSGIELLVDPELGRFARSAALPVLEPIVNRYHYGFPGEVGAGGYTRSLPAEPATSESGGGPIGPLPATGSLTIADSRTYRLPILAADTIQSTVLQAGDTKRPHVLVEGDGTAAANLTPASGASRSFHADGIWFGSFFDDRTDFVIERAASPEPSFDWETITITHCTLDPGGVRADATPIAPLVLLVRGRIQRLVIERSIVAPIIVDFDATDPGSIETLELRDCIVDASGVEPTGDRQVAIMNPTGKVVMNGCTVFGDVHAGVLEANDSIVSGRLVVANTQDSCFRFSAASLGEEGTDGRLPKLYRVPPIDLIQNHFFVSTRFGHPGYAELSLAAPDEILRGAENTSEMGAFSFLMRPIQLGSVRAKVDEFKPVGVLPQFILEGSSARLSEPAE